MRSKLRIVSFFICLFSPLFLQAEIKSSTIIINAQNGIFSCTDSNGHPLINVGPATFEMFTGLKYIHCDLSSNNTHLTNSYRITVDRSPPGLKEYAFYIRLYRSPDDQHWTELQALSCKANVYVSMKYEAPNTHVSNFSCK